MGEKKRRGLKMELVNQIEVFDPRALETGADRVKREAVIEGVRRSRMRPTALCGACDYEFRFGELPPRLYVVRPFIDPPPSFQFLSGFICSSCALDPGVAFKIFAYLHEQNPDLQLLQPGSA
jgi:hypothetical protein